ncbi:cupin domain-containing protein [Streptomyces sp. NBC_00582]|uniref:cupin domain-containing protein n=1 Tax=Streptomyces sp. NBC_00582 TaxID=2975783 RepID=UPI0010E0F31C|nr:cupin domain-containing protein [Streptomyces sp. NBC_00582]
MRPDQSPPLHTHSREDESWIILSGRVRFWVGSTSLDECDVHEAEPGAFVWGPRSVPHTYQAITSTAELLCIINPGAIEGHFHAAGAADAPSDAAHSLLEEYGFVIHDNPPPAPRRTDHECRRRSPGLIMATKSSDGTACAAPRGGSRVPKAMPG